MRSDLEEEADMDDMEKILRRNPKAARDIDGVKAAVDVLVKLRANGLAHGPTPLASPYSGRYEKPRQTSKKALTAFKMTF